MYAIIKDGIVVDVFIGSLDDASTKYKDYQIIQMTLENSPAHINGRWDGVKFYEPEK
jgi:hypothetical protein